MLVYSLHRDKQPNTDMKTFTDLYYSVTTRKFGSGKKCTLDITLKHKVFDDKSSVVTQVEIY